MYRQVFFALAVFFLSGGGAVAQSCSLPAIAASVDLKEVPGSNLVTVPVEINGKPKQFLLDISTAPMEISQAAVAEIGLPGIGATGDSTQFDMQLGPTGTAISSSVQSMSASVYDVNGARSRAATRARVRVADFTIGGATGHNMQFAISNDRDLGETKPYDGHMTGSFFRQYDVELDFAGKKLNYLTPTACDDPNQVVFWPHGAIAEVPMTMAGGRMEVSVTIEGHAINAVVDTSYDRTVMRRDVAERLFGLETDTPGMAPVADLKDGMGQRVYSHTFPQISLEGITARNVPALIQANSMIHNVNRTPILGSRAKFAAEPRIPDLTLGMDVLRQLHLYAVFGQEKLYVTAAE
jgi:predicted aspartyl protease